MADVTENKAKQGFFKGMAKEFKKITWPSKSTLAKESVAVVIISVVVGALIALIDAAIKLGLDKVII